MSSLRIVGQTWQLERPVLDLGRALAQAGALALVAAMLASLFLLATRGPHLAADDLASLKTPEVAEAP